MKIFTAFLLFFVSTFLISCSSQVQRYSLNPEIQSILKDYSKNKKIKFAVEVSGENESKKLCRLAMEIAPPDNKTFEKYIEDAFVDELKLQNLYDKKSKQVIKISISELDFDTAKGFWIISGDVTLPDGKAFSITEMYVFGFIYFADQACREVMRTFPNVVQDFIKEIIKHPDFVSYVKKYRT